MDKEEAIERLNQQLQRVPELKKLNYVAADFDEREGNRRKLYLWTDKCRIIIKEGLDPDDLREFASHRGGHVVGFEEQEDYTGKLIDYETALISIIDKYELIGIETESTPIVEPKDKAEMPVYLFDKFQFHPKVVEVSRSLFKDGHYADAIFKAFVAVNVTVKKRAGSPKDRGTDKSLDGKKLMSHVFNKNKPLIKLNNLIEDFEKDEQEGFMYLFMGATVGIRNPKAHVNIVQTDPFITLEYLGLASLLLKRIEGWQVAKLRSKT